MHSSLVNQPKLLRPPASSDQRWVQLKHDLHVRLVQAVNHTALREMEEEQVREQLRAGAVELCRNRPNLLTHAERNRLIEELVDETLGFGPLEKLLRDPEISDILVDGPFSIYVERHGRLEKTAVSFLDEASLLESLQKIVSRVGRRIDEASPMVDARLPDGSRINAVIPPLAVDGTLVSIRRNVAKTLTPETLLANQTLSKQMLEFLLASVRAKANILISGGTGSGKTTFLNLLSQAIPDEERVVTIEDAGELRLAQPRVARLETRPPNVEGRGEITTRDLVRNALRMRPERIIVGECRGGEAFDMLQAMNTGHEGSMTTIHANSCPDAIARLEMLASLAGVPISPEQNLRQIAASIHLVVQVCRYPCGSRKVVQIAEVACIRDGNIQVRELFAFSPDGVDAQGRVTGRFPCRQPSDRIARRLQEHLASRGLLQGR